MTTKTVKYKGEKVIDIVLTEDETQLDEEVVSAKTNINEIDIRAKSGVVQSIDIKRVDENKGRADFYIAVPTDMSVSY